MRRELGRYVTGVEDDVLVTLSEHHASFSVSFFQDKVIVQIGHCHMHLELDKAVRFRELLDAGIADALADHVSHGPLSAA